MEEDVSLSLSHRNEPETAVLHEFLDGALWHVQHPLNRLTVPRTAPTGTEPRDASGQIAWPTLQTASVLDAAGTFPNFREPRQSNISLKETQISAVECSFRCELSEAIGGHSRSSVAVRGRRS